LDSKLGDELSGAQRPACKGRRRFLAEVRVGQRRQKATKEDPEAQAEEAPEEDATPAS
jgi:hypothetical protein